MKTFLIFLVASLLLVAGPSQEGEAQRSFKVLPLGTVFVCRNLDESLNTSPGYWNHLAILVNADTVVESQQSQGVIETPLSAFYQRGYNLGVIFPRSKEMGEMAAKFAKQEVGRPYGKISSIGPFWRFGRRNCVSVIERVYARAAQKLKLIGVWKPDKILYRRDLFTDQVPQWAEDY